MLATLASALTAVLVHSSPFDVITAKDKEWSEYYNTGNWAGLQSCYNPAAEVVPPTADGFLLGNETGAFFRGAGLKNVSLTPLHVIQEAPALIHELGQATHSAGTFRYYVRWIKPMGADWQIALDVFPIGEAKSARSLVMVEDSAERETTTETTSLASWFSTSASAGRSRSAGKAPIDIIAAKDKEWSDYYVRRAETPIPPRSTRRPASSHAVACLLARCMSIDASLARHFSAGARAERGRLGELAVVLQPRRLRRRRHRECVRAR